MKAIINHISEQLKPLYPADEAHTLAWWIVEETTGMSRTELLTGCKDTTFSADMQMIVARLLKKEPIQYIFGHTLWCGLDLKLTSATLIPRPETAEVVEAITHFQLFRPPHPPIRILDIGTGSGCIALALKNAHPQWEVSGLDVSAEALAIARENGDRNGLEVNWIEQDIMTDPIGIYDVIVSNPPYITDSERAEMDANVLDYEPHTALFVPDSDPLRFYRRIASLKAAEWLFFEINPRYEQEMVDMMKHLGYTDIMILKDIYGKARILIGRIAQ